MTMFRSAVPLQDRKPRAPEYTPRASVSSESMISIGAQLGRAGHRAAGEAGADRVQGVDTGAQLSPHVDTSWWTVA
jgi:hypothetical protein